HAAMGRGVTGQLTGMQRHPAPSQPFHMRHWRVVEFAEIMLLGLLQNGEHTERRLVTFLSRRAGRDADQNSVAINEGALLRHRYNDGNGALRPALGMASAPTRLEIFEIVRRSFRCRLGAFAALLSPGLGQ